MRKPLPTVRRLSRRRLLGHAGLALGGALGLRLSPRVAYGATPRSGEIVAAVSERMLVLDPADHYSISTTSVLRHVFDPLIDVTNDHKFPPALAESWEAIDNTTWRTSAPSSAPWSCCSPASASSAWGCSRRIPPGGTCSPR